MKRVTLVFILAIFTFFLYQLFFSYRIIPFPNSGDQKHKIYDVFYFPDPYLAFFNPFKKTTLKQKIIEYSKTANYKNRADSLFNNKSYFMNFIPIIESNKFKLLSIKYEKPNYHILICKLKDKESTVVFLLSKKTDKIVGYY